MYAIRSYYETGNLQISQLVLLKAETPAEAQGQRCHSGRVVQRVIVTSIKGRRQDRNNFV